MKRILLTTYVDAFLYQGGGEIEIKNLHKHLNISGFICDIYGATSLEVDNYDVIIHFGLGGGTNLLLDQIDCSNKTLILWPNLWFTKEPDESNKAFLQSQIDRFDMVVIKSDTESAHLDSYFNIPSMNKLIISPFVDSEIYNFKGSDLFRQAFDLDKYVFWAGIIEPQKNQLSAIKAMKESDLSLVLSGSSRNPLYLNECKKEAEGSNVIILPPMDFMSELHLSAIANCEMYLEIPLDFPGTSSIEASILNNNLCITDCKWSREIFTDDVGFVDPLDIGAIMSFIEGVTKRDFGKSVLIKSPKDYSPDIALAPLVHYIVNH